MTLSVVSVKGVQLSIPWGNEARCFIEKNENPGSINKYTKFSQLIIWKITKRLPPDATL